MDLYLQMRNEISIEPIINTLRLSTELFKSIIKYSGLSFFVLSIGYVFLNWDDYFVRLFPDITVLGANITFMFTVFFYFFEILQSEKILSFYKSLNFYISAAIFIW